MMNRVRTVIGFQLDGILYGVTFLYVDRVVW